MSALSLDLVNTLSSCVMAVGALLIFWQVLQSRRQAVTQFEDSLTREYREIIHELSPRALLGEAVDEKEISASLGQFLRYVDLCNQQAFLRSKGRIRRSTWVDWVDGMRSNFELPAFTMAWTMIKGKAGSSFQELRRLEQSRFAEDPIHWR